MSQDSVDFENHGVYYMERITSIECYHISTMSQTRSWIQIDPKSHFSLNNLPFGIISTKTEPEHRPAVAIGDFALDLHAFSKGNGFVQFRASSREHLILAFSSPTLNAFAALGRPVHREVRSYLQSIFRVDTPHPELLQDNKSLRAEALIPLSQIQSHLPLSIGDYTDFFAGRNHAFNVGTLFRGPQNALQPNYTHLPVAYHGRASSVVVSGTPIHRPWGQILLDPKAEPKVPTFMPCKRLDIELELGMFVCKGNDFGRPIPIHRAEEYIFGYVLMNDWSARDIQLWEYVPLGPFNAKNFGTTISPWVVLADALEPFRVKGLENGTDLQEYLKDNREDTALSIELQVDLKSKFLMVSQPAVLLVIE